MKGISGKVAVVTGAARGIGRACAERLLAEGAKVALLDIEREAGARTAREMGSDSNVTFVECDVGYKKPVDEAISAVLQKFGRIDILVNNAGIIRRYDFLTLPEEDFDAVIRTNLKSVYLLGQRVAQHMVESKIRGAIVNMASTSVIMTMPTIPAYAASKGGISSLTRAMALSLAVHGIRVNAVGPGTIVTELNKAALLTDEDNRNRILARTPLGRFGEGADVASVVCFLASDESSYMAGQTVYVDGGRAGLNYTMPPIQKS
jgi:NAD(P)-dependent dehydrogenase (short-subunit alcohol dehydrogenase family)